MKKVTALIYLLIMLFLSISCGKTEDMNLDNPGDKTEEGDTGDDEPGNDNELFFGGNDVIKYNSSHVFHRTIYVDAQNGDDNRDGLSEATAIKSLKRLAGLSLTYGDQVLLRGGYVYKGSIELKNLNQKATGNDQYIHIGSYGERKAIIDFAGYPNGILVENSSRIEITDLKIKGNGGLQSFYMYKEDDLGKKFRYGIWVYSNGSSGTNTLIDNIMIYNVDVCDVFYYNMNETPGGRPCKEWSTANEDYYGWGIRGLARNNGEGIKDLQIKECYIRNVSHTGIKINGNNKGHIENLKIEDCFIYETGGPGSQFSHAYNSLMKGCRTINSGSRNDSRKWGRGSGMWVYSCNGFLFEHNHFEGAEGIADCCGAHIDIGNTDVVIQYCFSKNNAGGFIEVLGKNKNCSYRYNISVDDGWRNLKDPLQANYWGSVGTDGCLMTVNGHTQENYVGPYSIYIYNNTIVCTSNLSYINPSIFEMATSAKGILVMNNIFWIPKKMSNTWSKHAYENGQFINNATDFRVTTGELNDIAKAIVRDMTPDEIEALDFMVKNNLYQLYNASYPTASNLLPERYWDEKALGGDPSFKNVNGGNPEDFIPSNFQVVKRGTEVVKLSSDDTDYGVLPKLKMEKDFFGNIIGEPIIGACVPK